ncbi:MAG TPA: acyltransferase family protein [Acidimicrobiia bacterium]
MTDTILDPMATEVAPQPRRHHFPGFDGFRAIAAVLVLVTHLTESARFNNIWGGEYFARMDAGVAIFFLVSGFLLYRPFVMARFRGTPGPGVVSFFWRRALRIYPAFWLVTLIAVYVFGDAPFGSPSQAFLHLSLLHIYSPTTVLQGPILQSWTLGTELSFYLFLPVYAAVIGWIAVRVRRVLAVELVGVVALYAFSVGWQLMILASPGRLDGMYMTWLPAWLDLFSMGMFLAVVSSWTANQGGRDQTLLARKWAPAACWALAALAFWAVATQIGLPRASIVYTRTEDMLRHVLYGATAFFLLLPGIFGPQDRGGIRKFLQLRVVVAVGLISYGIYLWHELWINEFLAWTGDTFGFSNLFWMSVVAVTLTFTAAALSYHFVEKPVLRFKSWKPVAKAHVGDQWTAFVATLARVAPRRGDTRRFVKWLALIGLAALAIRVVYVLTVATHNPGFGDGFYYHEQANLLASGKGFANPFLYSLKGIVTPTAIHPPLFSMVLSIPSFLGLQSFLAHKLMSCLIGTALVVAIGVLGRRIGGDRVGLIAAGAAAIYPNLWAIDGILLPEGLFALTVVLVVLATYRFLDRPGIARAAVLGGLLGLALLVRGEAIFLLATIALIVAIVIRHRGWRSTLGLVAVLGAATLLVVSPWLIRNETRFERPVAFSTNSGDVLAQSNCDETYYGPTIGYWVYLCSARIPVTGDESQIANQRSQTAIDYIRDHRSRVPVVVAARVGRLWDVYQPITNTELSTIEGRDLNVSRAGLAMYAVLVPFALLGFVVLRRRRRPRLSPLLAPALMVTITAMTTYGEIRFRAAAEGTIVILAAVAVDALLRRRRPADVISLDELDASVPSHAVVPQLAQTGVLVSPAVQVDVPVDPAEEPAPNGDQPATPAGRRWSLDRLSNRTRNVLLIGTLLLLALLPVRGMLRSQGPPMEEGFMLVFPKMVLDGAVANKDFLHLYGPGSLWVLAGVYKLFGVTLQVERLFGLLQQIGVILGVVLLARRWGRTAALFCGALSIVFVMPPIGLTALAWVGGLGLALLGVSCCVEMRRADDERRARRWALAAGLLFAVALLYRPELVLAIALGGGALVWGTTRAVKLRLAAGLALAVVGYAVHVAMAGLNNVWQGMVLDPLVHLRGGRALPVPPSFNQYDGWLQRVGEIGQLKWFPALKGPTQLALWFFILLACAALLLVVGIRTFRRDRSSLLGRTLLAIALFSCGIVPQAMQRDDSTHLAWVSCVVIAFAPLALIELLRGWRPTWSVRRCAATCGVALVALVVIVIPYSEVRSYADYTLQSFGIHRSAHEMRNGDQIFYYGRYDAWQALEQMIPDLEKMSKPGDRLFVGTGDLRKTPFSEAWLYYMFPKLTPATYYIEMDPGIANAKNSRLAGDVASADWVIKSTVWDGFDEPNDSEKFGPDRPNQVLRDKFCSVGVYGNGLYELLKRCKP